ncbi:MAG: hypothetical protein ACI814_002645 [Mariniblastus sp.]|jgi:hypothetical protein
MFWLTVKNCFILFALIFSIIFTGQPALAWNGHGHRVIASMAFLRLAPDRRLEIANRIRKHPRWQKDFADKMPPAIKFANAQTQAEWIFQQASIWPDTTESFPSAERKKYSHGTWHYVNIIAYLDPSDKNAIGPIESNLSTQPPKGLTEYMYMNVIQAIEFARLRVAGTVTVSAEDDALMLCWLLHSYSDFHQPLHSTAMFSKTLLPTGCRGGNLIPTTQSKNLHSLWDGLLGNDNAYQTCHNQAVKMLADNELAENGRAASFDVTTEAVANESHSACLVFVYADEVKAHLQRLEQAGETRVAEINLSQVYLKAAGATAKSQANKAGWRLGEVLKAN